MREIKFRAWDAVKKIWLHFDISQNPEYWSGKIKDCPLQQYTGLKDKNGKEIYEGDILGGKNAFGRDVRATVEWGKIGWEAHEDNELNLQWKEWEVIGNIYENPELLK